jgi:hypothetical protein
MDSGKVRGEQVGFAAANPTSVRAGVGFAEANPTYDVSSVLLHPGDQG